jgi:ribosomal protein S18 acetylase RimI-like enzyme
MSASATSTALAAATRPATHADVDTVAAIFGRAFEDYRRGLGVDAQTLTRLWHGSLGARVASTTVAALPDGRVAGFVLTVKPGETEQYGSRRDGRERMRVWREVFGLRSFWRVPALFMPMGLAYSRRHAHKDELYVSLLGVDPDLQGRGVGQALLAAADAQARAAGAAAILLHTASTNARARASYARAGYTLVCTVRAPWRGPAQIPAYVALRKPLVPDTTPRLDRLSTALSPLPLGEG